MDASTSEALPLPDTHRLRNELANGFELEDERVLEFLDGLNEDVKTALGFRSRSPEAGESLDQHPTLYLDFVKVMERKAEGMEDEAAIKQLAFPEDFDKLYKLLRIFTMGTTSKGHDNLFLITSRAL
ncbi:hypothetical protein H2201_001038 [Coniosporium apollinis]|uniref:Uncharacterized protein n=2 Tax=Coniosporium TaxID=2810619 RepID=A0ABQ9P2F3_9PEZI|nr:hypothetical protein H2199_003169 [Cladosporium sp. JES 115]KAJ9668792.1 hypothetical protein H2201_001038 [Coniosporium apollinis]